MRRLVTLLAIFATSCCDQSVPEPEPEPDSGTIQYCEQYQHAPAPCWGQDCPVGERVCGNERVCKDWDDCNVPGSDSGPSECFQCRTLHWCDCL